MTRIRFVIDLDGQPKTVFQVSEQKSGDLNFHITSGGRGFSAATLADLVVTVDESKFEDYEKHISVHCSPNSSEVNVVKQTQRYADHKSSVCQYTTGIKVDDEFIPIFFRVCGDLARDRYALPKSGADRFINLGSMNPQEGQLRFLAFCSRPGKVFPKDDEHPSNHLTHTFEKFSLHVLWSFLNVPPHPQAIDFFIGTRQETGPVRGLEWYEIYDLYTDLHMTHATNYLEVINDRSTE